MDLFSLKAHAAADAFPMMPELRLAELAADIKAHGLREPIVICNGGAEWVVLDGRNRLQACARVGVTPSSIVFDGSERERCAFVMSKNVHRRDLDTSQRAMVAAKLANLGNGQRKSTSADLRSLSPVTQEEASEKLNVSIRTTQKARKVIEYGTPELAAAVDAGEVSVDSAEKVVNRSPAEQRALIEGGMRAARRVREEMEMAPMEVLRRKEEIDPTAKAREMFAEGYTVHDIHEATGLSKGKAHHAVRALRKKAGPLAHITEEVEVFADLLRSRANSAPESWDSASAEERKCLVAALDACRAACGRLTKRLNKDAAKETESNEAHQDQAV